MTAPTTMTAGEAFDPTPANIDARTVRSELPSGMKLALPMIWLALMLKRFSFTRIPGVLLHWLSFISYALGCAVMA